MSIGGASLDGRNNRMAVTSATAATAAAIANTRARGDGRSAAISCSRGANESAPPGGGSSSLNSSSVFMRDDSLHVEPLAQQRERARPARADGAFGDAERRRDLRIRHAGELREQQHVPQRRRQIVECFAYGL